MRAIIFANGLMAGWPVGFDIFPDEDFIIAADGGLKHCSGRGIVPHLVVGDMDSADPGELVALEKKGVEVNRFPARKDETDLWLAVRAALDRKVYEIIILGALGGRWDMTFSNVLLLTSPEFKQIETRIMDGNQELFVLQGGQAARLFGNKGDLLSLMPLTAMVKGLTLTGFEYPLDNETLELGTTRGISNVFVEDVCRIEFSRGKLLVTVTHSGS
jgi:thiamine pyrophosphokinase